jgi:hypothetical protein
MKNKVLRRVAMACLVLVTVIVVVLMSPIPRLAANSSGVLDACVNPGNGMMRLVDSNSACHANETFVEWNITGPQGPAGPQGPQGPAGAQGQQGPPGASAGGPPFVWVCTPANLDAPQFGNELDIFNGSGTAANVAAHFLSADGTNLAGNTVPGLNPPATFPGQTGNNTVTLASQNTMIITFANGVGTRQANPSTLLATISVVSDRPVVVAYNIPSVSRQSTPCSLLPR